MENYKFMKKNIKRNIVVFALFIVSFFAFTGKLKVLTDSINLAHNSNETYLQSAQEKAIVGFLALSGIKTGLAVIEGSEVNVGILGTGASIEAGDIVKAVYDFVDWLWRTAIIGGVMLGILKMSVYLSAILSPIALGCLTLLTGIYMIIKPFIEKPVLSRCLQDLFLFLTFVFLSLQFILPLSVYTAFKLSIIITQPKMEEVADNFYVFGEQFSKKENEGDISYAKRLSANLPAINENLKNNAKKISSDGIQYITAYLFDCIVFPLGLFLLFEKCLSSVMRYMFEISRENGLKPGLEKLILSSVSKLPESSK